MFINRQGWCDWFLTLGNLDKQDRFSHFLQDYGLLEKPYDQLVFILHVNSALNQYPVLHLNLNQNFPNQRKNLLNLPKLIQGSILSLCQL